MTSLKDRRIVLVGFMACGKTTVGEGLARQLECSFIDLDSQITESQGRSPAQIIKADGEAAFRRIESLALREVLQNRDARVIALGGGTWTIPANRKLIALHDCATVWIDAPFDLCWYRITGSTNTVRPLAPNWASARKLYAARRASYQLAQLRVEAHKKKKSRQMVSEITAALAG